MSGIKLDGVIVAKKVKESVKKAVTHLKNEGVEPCLATVLVGDDAASATYVHNKHQRRARIALAYIIARLDDMPSLRRMYSLRRDFFSALNALT